MSNAVKFSPSQEQVRIFDWFAAGPAKASKLFGSHHAIVRARAGTGKTTTIEQGISHAPERKIAYVVFNKKNQIEAKDKIKDRRVKVYTCNALGYCFVKFVGKWDVKPDDRVEYDRVKDAMTAAEAQKSNAAVVADIVNIVAFAKNTKPFAKVQDLVNIALARGVTPNEANARAGWTIETYARIAHKAMDKAKKKDRQKRISFNDQVWLPVVMGWTVPWYQLVVIDEAQDTSPTGLLLAKKACQKNGRILLVGDDRQAIYGFRGADTDALDKAKTELEAAEFGLTQTYRCPRSVVALAKELVPDYVAADSAPEGVISKTTTDDVAAKPGDAVLSRTNAPLLPLCLGFLKAGIPAHIEGRDIGRQLLKLVAKFEAFSKIEDFITAITSWCDEHCKRLEASGASDSAIDSIVDQCDVLVCLATDSSSVNEIKNRIKDLFQDSDGLPRPTVCLSSVHKAKGLEWGHTFLLEDTFKRGREEDNIRYVAITRAKQELTWVRRAQKDKQPRA